MRWISFEEMQPPVGMYIFVHEGRCIGMIYWDPQRIENNDNGGMIDMYNNTWCKPICMWELEAWAPVEFLEHPFDWDYKLNRRNNWLLKNKNHPNIPIIKSLIGDPGRLQELHKLFDEINEGKQ